VLCNDGGKIGRARGTFGRVIAVGLGGPLSNLRGAGVALVMLRAGAVVLRGKESFFGEDVGIGCDRSLPNSLIDRFFVLQAFPLLYRSVCVTPQFVFSTDLYKSLRIGEDILLVFRFGVSVIP
jgi:hypothetical protein